MKWPRRRSRCCARTTSAAGPRRRHGSTRTSGAGTAPSSRSASPMSIRPGQRRSCGASSRRSGRPGLLPHIVFNPDVPPESYFPDAECWNVANLSADVPAGKLTSGLIQPPVHAIAAWRIREVAERRSAADRSGGGCLPARDLPEAVRLAPLPADRARPGSIGPGHDLPPLGERTR